MAKEAKNRQATDQSRSRGDHWKGNDYAKFRLETVLRYGTAGLPVVPMHGTSDGFCTCDDDQCKNPGRHPRTPNGLKDATTNPSAIEALWQKWPTARAGIALGSRSNLCALVTEGDKGEEGLQRLRGDQGLKRTVTIRDDERRIRVFRIPAGYTVRHAQLAPGLTVLGENTCLVMPSGKITAKRRFASDLGIGQIEIATAPRWLLDQITRVATKASSRRRRSSAAPKTTIKPQRSSESSVMPPTELGQSLARLGRPASRNQSRADFATAIQVLKKLMTKPSEDFEGITEPLDLEIIANFLKQIAATAEKSP
jgi:hypothetical protein